MFKKKNLSEQKKNFFIVLYYRTQHNIKCITVGKREEASIIADRTVWKHKITIAIRAKLW